MATSGTYTFNLNKTEIIARAFNIINVYEKTQTPSTKDFNFASDVLNMMLKVWEAEDGIRLWKRRQAVLFTAQDQTSYQIGSVSGADHCTHTMVNTVTTADVLSGISVIPVESTTGLSTTMNIGLEQDDGSRIWGTISSINGLNVTCSFMTTDTVAEGKTVVAYTSKINRPLSVIRGTMYDLTTESENQLALLSYDDYFNMPVKTMSGEKPNNFYYDKVLNNGLPYTGTFYMFPTPSQTKNVVKFTYLDSVQDMLNATDTVDFPQEWLYPIVFNLATELAYSYGKFVELQVLQPKAQQLKDSLSNFDADDASLNLTV